LQKKGPGGVITDLKIPGKNRRIAFVGYKTSDEAQKAQEWFNKTFIGMARINVEIADDSKSVEKVKGASALAKRKALDEEAGSARKKRKVEKDATFEEFKNTFAKKIDGRSWGGDDDEENVVKVQSEQSRYQEDEDEQRKIQETGLSDADWLKRRTAGVCSTLDICG
jgi:multiple RNA-binding domain-containing protein 1